VLDIAESGMKYAPGDIAMVLPQNDQASVNLLLERYGLEKDDVL